jgi:hypothetical protein
MHSIANKDFRQEPFVVQQKSKSAATQEQVAPLAPRCKFPVVPFPGMLQNPLVKEDCNVEELHRKLVSVCASCEFKNTPSICEFICVAQAEDGSEQCKFVVNLWSSPHCPNKCFIQVDRHAGCPFFFRQVLCKVVGSPCAESETCAKKPRLFRAPALPESLKEESKPDTSSVESAIALATSNVYEQRVQGAVVLADLCTQSPEFASVFKSVNGLERISMLHNDSNSYVQRAVSRILVNV